MYNNNSLDAILAMERDRTGNYGYDEDYVDHDDYEDEDELFDVYGHRRRRERIDDDEDGIPYVIRKYKR